MHCWHFHGWTLQRWCWQCRQHWEETCGQIRDRDYEALCEADLAHQVLVEMERGDLAIPPDFDPLERVSILPLLEPSTS